MLVKSGPIWTLSDPGSEAVWATAMSNCEALGQHLAVLDVRQKKFDLIDQK